jgi:hypothetical protein
MTIPHATSRRAPHTALNPMALRTRGANNAVQRRIGLGRAVGVTAKMLASAVAVAVAAYALYLLAAGVRWVIVLGDDPAPSVQYRPYVLAVIPLAAAALLLTGMWWKRQVLAWAGILILGVVGALTIWSVGLYIVAAALVLAVLLAVRSLAEA